MAARPPQVDESKTNRRSWRRWLPRFSLRGVLIFQAVIAALLAVAYWWPKSGQLQIFAIPSDRNIGFYRGLGLVDGPGFFGRDYYRFQLTLGEPVEMVSVEVLYDGDEYSPFRGNYPDGTLRLEGTCRVETFNRWDPLPIVGEMEDGGFYHPDGTLGSEVIDGTGAATFWTDDGKVILEWRVENYEIVSSTSYDGEGNVTKQEPP